MEKQPKQTQDTIAEAIRNQFLKDQSVVGIWSRLRVRGGRNYRELVIEKLSDVKRITIDPNGEVSEIPGKIVAKRKDTGLPVRHVAFIPTDGSEETCIQEHEF